MASEKKLEKAMLHIASELGLKEIESINRTDGIEVVGVKDMMNMRLVEVAPGMVGTYVGESQVYHKSVPNMRATHGYILGVKQALTNSQNN